MPFGAKDQRDIGMVTLFLAGLLLVFGTVPLLNVSVTTPLIAGVTLGTLIGAVVLYVAYLMQKKKM